MPNQDQIIDAEMARSIQTDVARALPLLAWVVTRNEAAYPRPVQQAHRDYRLPTTGVIHTFSSRLSSLRKRQSVCSAMSFCGSDLIKPASCIRNA